jgi:Concanavalin A-like lectin/glucanases superfamily
MLALSGPDRVGATDGDYVFAGNGYLTVNNPKIVTNNAMTYSFWTKNISSGPASLFSFTSVGSRNFFSIWLSNGKLYPELAWYNGSNVGIQAVTANKIVNDNKWHKIDVTIRNNPNAEMKSYIDGLLESTTNYNAPYSLQNIPNTMTIGAVQNWLMNIYQVHFTGEIDDVRSYDRALTASEVTAVYNDDRSSMLASYGLDGVDESLPGTPTPFDSSLLPAEYSLVTTQPVKAVEIKPEEKMINVIENKVEQIVDKVIEKVVEKVKELIGEIKQNVLPLSEGK